MQIRPGQQVYYAYLIPNPGDSNTYYPQAVVKNTQTQAVIATVNLTQDPTQKLRYYGSFISPADSVGNGYFMDNVCIPYTDSGHTTPSLNYGADMVQYFAWQPPPYYGGGDAVLIDYEKIELIMDNKIKAIKLPKQQRIIIPEFPEIVIPKVDLEPIHAKLSDLEKNISGVHERVSSLPKPKDVDFTPLYEQLNGVHKAIGGVHETHQREVAELEERIQETIESRMSEHAHSVDERMEEIENKGVPIQMMAYRPAPPEPKERRKLTPKEIMRELSKRT